MHCTTLCEVSEVDGDKSDSVDQRDHYLFGFGVVARCKDDGAGFVGREVLYPGHRDVADRFHKPCANCHLSDHLARRTPSQCGPRSGHASETNVWGLQMRVRRIDQDAASPINTLESVSYSDPMRGKKDDVALGCLLLRAGDGAWTETSDKISQCLRTSGIGYNDGVTSVDQVTTESPRYFTSTYKPHFHDESPFSVGIANEFAFQLIATISRVSPDSGDRPETGRSHRVPAWRRPAYQCRTEIRAACLPTRPREHPPRQQQPAQYNGASHRAAPHHRRHGCGPAVARRVCHTAERPMDQPGHNRPDRSVRARLPANGGSRDRLRHVSPSL